MVRIGTRASTLARIQAESVLARLRAACPDETFSLVLVTTRGDRVLDRPVAELGGSAAFTSELERALLSHEIDLAVHSMKDLPSACADGLVLAKAWTRADPRDALVLRPPYASIDDLPAGARVATGSPRRQLLLRRLRPDLKPVDLRGNVDTRLAKLFAPAPGDTPPDALLLAAAGLDRLGRSDVIAERLDPLRFIPAANQGQLAVELRADDTALKTMVDALGSDADERIALAERGFLREIGADCHAPVGAFASESSDGLTLTAVFARDVSSEPIVVRVTAPTPQQAAFLAAAAVRRRIAGAVTLVGAGPGDPELITVKGLAALREADAVVYDRLVSPALLDAAPPNCVRLYVGKESGRHTMPQDEINAALLRLSMTCRHVVRLKGGDPCVFGRGSEEAAYLEERGVSCRFIPGVTSAVAAAESARIPVTHRGVAEGFVVITAHGQEGAPVAVDFARLVDPRLTCVFLMGLSRVGELAASLVAAGRSAATPAAVISAATSPHERTAVGTLADIAHRSAALASPAVLIVGDVVTLRRKLGLPLSGRRLLVPSIGAEPSRLASALTSLGADVVSPQVGRIVPFGEALAPSDLTDVTWLAFTSRNGALRLDSSIVRVIREKGISVAAIGETTQKALEERGLAVDFTSAASTGRAFCDELLTRLVSDDRVLHLTAADTPDALAALAEKCAFVSRPVYRNEPVSQPAPHALADYDAAVFTCASSARRLLASASGSTRLFAIGPATAAALPASFGPLSVAPHPDVDALVATVVASFASF